MKMAQLAAGDVLMADFTVRVLRPCFYFAKDDARKRLFFVVRGTHSLRDVRWKSSRLVFFVHALTQPPCHPRHVSPCCHAVCVFVPGGDMGRC